MSPGSPTDDPDSSDTRPGRLLQSAAAFERELWVLVVCVMLVDVVLTVHGRQIGLTERNPVASTLMASYGIVALYALKVLAIGVGAVCHRALSGNHCVVVPIGLAIPNVIAVCLNIVTIGSVTL